VRFQVYLDAEGKLQFLAPIPAKESLTTFVKAVPDGADSGMLRTFETDLPDELAAKLSDIAQLEDPEAVVRLVEQFLALRPELPSLPI
jgi:hypothetical protein